MNNENIISQNEVILYGRKYKEITYDNGEQILKRFDEKSKMWVTLKFSDNENPVKIKLIQEVTKNALFNTIQV